MRDEIRRINKLVAEGKLSPDDAADLIDAFYQAEREESEGEPTPPPTADGSAGRSATEPLKGIIEQIEKLTKEGVDAVDWKEVSKQARHSAKRGFDFLRTGLEELSKGKINLFGSVDTKELTLPLTVAEGKTLKVENACGDVRIKGGVEPGSVYAVARFRGASLEDARAKAAQYTLMIEESDHQVVLRQPDVGGLTVDLEIKIGKAPVEVKTEAGDVEVDGTSSACRVSSRSGGILLRGLNGPVEANSESGDVTVENTETPSLAVETKAGDITLRRVQGNMNVRTATGDLSTYECSGKVIALESISGDLKVDIEQPISGSLNIRTVNGDATVGIADGSDCRVSLSTLRGTVNCGLELGDEAKAQQRITGKLGEGSGTLDVSAVTGNVKLELRNTQAAAV